MVKIKLTHVPKRRADRLLKSRAADLDMEVQKLMKGCTVSALDELRRDLESRAQLMITIASYVSVRAGCTGCGVHPHAVAAYTANRQQAKVRRALGYSVPDRINYPIP